MILSLFKIHIAVIINLISNQKMQTPCIRQQYSNKHFVSEISQRSVVMNENKSTLDNCQQLLW